jgi:perosamine synthetase
LQAFTCSAVPEGIMAVGASPLYVDVEQGSFTMSAPELERRITARTRAIVVQHTFGIPADLNRILAVAARHHIPVVEDCAHTVASVIDGRRVGTSGVAAFYSFEASKPVFIGLGGSAVVNDRDLRAAMERAYDDFVMPSRLTQAQLLAMFAAHRVLYRPWAYWWIRAVFRRLVSLGLIKGNYNELEPTKGPAEDFGLRLGSLQGKILARELRGLERQTAHRRLVAARYREGIVARGARHPLLPTGAEPVYGRYPLIVEDRSELLERAPKARVELADFYSTPVHPFRGEGLRAVGYEPGSCPNAEWISDHVVSLPTAPSVSPRSADRAVAFVNAVAAG